ncbi:MAG: molybdopterin-dependent oxidoreductase [Candidatus Binatia bacterium]
MAEGPLSTLSRRDILRAGLTAALVAGFGPLRLAAAPSAAATAVPIPPYRDWRDVYRARWRWDRVARGTHTNANCVSSCAWNLYVRNGVVWREEQAAPYVASNDTVPDWNPRGCQKGACYTHLSTGPSRIVHPLRRVGRRGGGKWRRVSWEQALDEVAETMVEVLARRGGQGVLCELGPNIDFGGNTTAGLRFFRQLGAPMTDAMAQIGDVPVGGTITLGTPHTDGTSDDWFRSDYLVLWAFNPAATRIPDAHFVHEARYHGTRVVVVAPDYNQTAVHSDLWLSVRPGTDAALALAACQVVLAEGLHQADYLREQTDLPFLVRSDTRRFLRESDVKAGGHDDRFAVWDEDRAALAWAPGSAGSTDRTLRLPAGMRPALDGTHEVTLASGQRVMVQPVLATLRERLDRDHTPEIAAKVTGLSPATIRRFAHDFATARAALILSQYGICKNYHSDLIQRSQILLASLTGNLGRAGGGWRSGAFVALDGMGLVAMQDSLDLVHLGMTAARAFLDAAAVRHEFEAMFIPSTLFHYVHGGLAVTAGAAEHGDPRLPHGAAPYVAEALAKKHFPMAPAPGDHPPEVLFSFCGNVLRHSRQGQRIRDTLFAGAKLVVDVNWKTSETGRHADIILPSAGWYEKVGIKYIASVVPYVTLGDRAVAPLGEAKPEWEIFALLAARIGAAAKRRGVTTVPGFRGQACDLAGLGERFTDGGRFGPGAEEDVTRFILKVSGATRGIGVDELRRDGGAVRIKTLGQQGGTAGFFSDYRLDEPVVPLRDFVERKQPYPTLTGRQQFYVDHPWFLELGEELPTHKDPPAAGGHHPFTLTGGHTRWSIHAMWRDHALMLRLQRGEPVVYLNTDDARQRGIADHAYVRVWNDVASFEARAKVAPGIRPGQAHIFHAWEPYQFRSGTSHQFVAPSPFKVTQLVGDYGHLHWAYAHYEPNQCDRDTRVDVAPIPPRA